MYNVPILNKSLLSIVNINNLGPSFFNNFQTEKSPIDMMHSLIRKKHQNNDRPGDKGRQAKQALTLLGRYWFSVTLTIYILSATANVLQGFPHFVVVILSFQLNQKRSLLHLNVQILINVSSPLFFCSDVDGLTESEVQKVCCLSLRGGHWLFMKTSLTSLNGLYYCSRGNKGSFIIFLFMLRFSLSFLLVLWDWKSSDKAPENLCCKRVLQKTKTADYNL